MLALLGGAGRAFLCRTLRGNMKTQKNRSAPPAARFSRLPLNSPRCAAVATRSTKSPAWQLRGLFMLAVVVLLLLLEPGKLFAQQIPPGDQARSQNDLYMGQYAPNRLEQQSYPGQQSDAQRPYSDSGQAYPDQGYGLGASSGTATKCGATGTTRGPNRTLSGHAGGPSPGRVDLPRSGCECRSLAADAGLHLL